MRPAARVAGESLSPIRRMSLGAPADAINLGLGEPGWSLPTGQALGDSSTPTGQAVGDLSTVTGQAVDDLSYGPNTSDPALVRAVASFAGTDDLAQVMVTAGSQAALFALFQSYVEVGSVVLVPDPGFVAYATLARLCGATPVGYPLGPGGDLDADALTDVLGEHGHTSLVVLNHPANPTGGLASEAALDRVARACADRDVLVVSDEVYAELWVDERPASLRDVTGQGVVFGSMSKAFAAPGLRIGWASGDADVLAPARLVHNAMTTAPSRLSQRAALALLERADEVLPAAREEVRARWECVDLVAPHLVGPHLRSPGIRPSETSPWQIEPPLNSGQRAGFYLWLPLTDDVDPADTEAFALRLRDEGGVTTIPGTAFGARGAGFLRVSLGGPVDDLEEGLRRLAPWWKG
ncbi:pyridoxal phosphate-dependent aminotransferase [Serinicoccus kebangsaanensis]|uniref:pyridoxal phosphate-dependent aminotransferase n=1 Tax=Serinicoccus kebangsaanensis TaxID=2602069 RepID=UPI00124E02E2|nr:pyridoxal phosphate-dependent aminotransferase [Serinicoccus kebangsaanensis]